MAKKTWDVRTGEEIGKRIIPAAKATLAPLIVAGKTAAWGGRTAANVATGAWNGVTGGQPEVAPVAPVQPVKQTSPALTTTLGPRAPLAPPVAIEPSVSGAGITANPMGITPLRTAPVTPVASGIPVAPADDFGGANDVLPVEVSATVPKNRFGGNTNAMAMTSPAALNLAEVMAMGRADSMRSQSGGKRRDPNGIEAQALRGRWADAARNAFLGAMSDTQREKFLREENARSMESAALYKNTPGAIEGEAARKRDVDVAQAAGGAVKAKNDIAAEGMKQEAELKREELALRAKGDEASLAQADRLAARSEELRKTLSTDDRKDKLADREEARKMKQYEVIGNQITRLLTSNNADPEVIKDKVAELEKQQARIMGFDTESAPTGKQPTAAERAKAALRGTPSLSSPAFQDGAMMTKGGKTYKRTNGVWVAQ